MPAARNSKVGFKIALAVVAGGAALLWARRRRDDDTDRAIDPPHVIDPDPATAHTATDDVDGDHPVGDSTTDQGVDATHSARRR